MIFSKFHEKIKNWFLKNAESSNAKWWLGIISFTESSFFPIPPDPFLIAVLMIKKQCWLHYSILVAVTSVLGGIFGYFIGFWFFELAGQPLVDIYNLQEPFDIVTNLFKDNTFWTTFVAAFTPIPYKIFTIAAGFSKVNFVVFVIASIIGRGIRYLIIGYIMKVFGEKIGKLVFKYFNILTILILILIVIYILFKTIV
ncbi:MAG: membrane protein YqaA with SNARE-associated domain [Candidatus Paceibacteria bacterium]|jgi:membrane protein YqaA with SNARE-associated domain